MQTKSPEVQFEINFARDLNLIFTDHKDTPDRELIKKRLAASVVKEYNDYFKHIGIDNVVFSYDPETGRIKAPNLENIARHKEEVAKSLSGIGIIRGVRKEDVLQIIEGVNENKGRWEEEISKMLDEDAEKIFNILKEKPVEKIMQRQINELNAAYAAKRNEYLISIAQILLAVSIIVTVSVLVSMAILPIAAVTAIPSVAIFALYEFRNIEKGLNNWLERTDAYEAWQKAKNKKEDLIKQIVDDKVRVYLEANPSLIGKDAKIDDTFEKAMLGIKRSKEMHKIPPHIATAPKQQVTHKYASKHEANSGQTVLAGENFRKYVREALVGIAADSSGKAKQNLIKDSLKGIFVEAHNEYFESIGLNDFKLVMDYRTKLVSLGNFDKDALIDVVGHMDLNQKQKDKLLKSFETLETELENLDVTLSDYALELSNAMNNQPKDNKKLDKSIDEITKEMDGLRSKLNASYVKITLAILLVIGMGVATFTGVIPMVAFTGAICTSTLFIAGALDSVFDNKSKISDLKTKIESANKSDLEQGTKMLGVSEKEFDNMKVGKHDQSPINMAVLKFVSQYQPEIPGPARSA